MSDPTFGGRIGRLAGESEPQWPDPARAPEPGPNVVVVLLDDLGFSDIGPYGSEIPTPNIDRLADAGVRFSNYHTSPLCSPSRAALLTGRNPHRAGYAGVANFDPGFPGWTLELGPDVPTLPQTLRDNGYATYAVGKWHLSRDAVMHDGAPRDSWPLQCGFDRFYGILEGWTNLHHPHRLVRDNSPVDIDSYPEGYYFTDDITDQAISYLKALRAHEADRPFFLYLAHGAVHGPLHAKPEDLDRHRGKYEDGWDVVRERRFARQLQQGLFAEGTTMAPRNSEPGHEVQPWDSHSDDERARFSRYMEAYAAMVDNVDQNLGRLLDTIEALGDADNTVVIFTSDNGATEEGGATGSRSYFKQFGGMGAMTGWELDAPRDPELIGGPQMLAHYPRGWGMASNTPFRLYKRSTHAGGVRVPMVVSWPKGLGAEARGAVRPQYQYVTDIMGTVLDLVGANPVDGQDGASFAPALTGGATESTHLEQYSECFGNRSFYRNGWKLVANHQRGAPYDDAEWELYDIEADPTEISDLAVAHPEKVQELAEAWDAAAWDNQVFPLDDGTGLLQLLRRPDDARFHEPVRILPGTPTLERYRSQRLIAFRSFAVDVEVDHADEDAGVLVAHGDQGGGYSVYVEDGQLTFAYNHFGEVTLVSAGPLQPGPRTITLAAHASGRFLWDFTVSIDGAEVASLPNTPILFGFAPFQGIDVGIDRRSPVVWDVYERHGAFPYSGHLHAVTYRPGPAADYDPDQLVPLLRAAGRAGQ